MPATPDSRRAISAGRVQRFVSLIDTVRYINWSRRLVLIYMGFVGGFPGIVWRLERSCKPASSNAGRFADWTSARGQSGSSPLNTASSSASMNASEINMAFVRHQQAGTFAFLIDRRTLRRKVVTGAGDLWFPAMRWLRGGGVRSRGRPRLWDLGAGRRMARCYPLGESGRK
jgi:hypothetical protein